MSSSSSSHSFSSLRDMLKPPPYKKPKSSSSSSSSSSSTLPLSEENYDPFAGLFDSLSVKESSGSSSFLDSFTPPVLSRAASCVSDLSLQATRVEKNPNPNGVVESMQEVEEEKKKRYPNGRSWCVKAGGPWKTNKPFPPPITCLKSIKNGKLFAYMKFNEDDKSFVVEEIKIPNRDLLRSSRDGGRLKLYLVLSDDDDDDDDDNDEASEMEEDEFEIVKVHDIEEEEEEEDSN